MSRLCGVGVGDKLNRHTTERADLWPAPPPHCITVRSAFNWRAEQALRPAIVNRKVCGGNRTWVAAQTQHILMTVFRTSRQRALDPLRIVGDLLRERVPRIAAALFPT